MTGRRRLSESISEGDGISILVEIDGDTPPEGRTTIDAVALVTPVNCIPAAVSLPVLVRGGSPAEAGAAGADGWLLAAGGDENVLAKRYAEARELGLECVVGIADEDELGLALAEVDPEIVLLSPREDDSDADIVERVLELLPDVPAGKLAVAELPLATRADLVALERAGVDGLLVRFEHAATLFAL